MRPVRPVPVAIFQSTPSLAAMRRARGELAGRSRVGISAVGPLGSGMGLAAAGWGAAAGCLGVGIGSPGCSTKPMTVPTARTSPQRGPSSRIWRMPSSKFSTFSGRLFAFERIERLPGPNRRAIGLQPADEDALFHVPAKPGDRDRIRHGSSLTLP